MIIKFDHITYVDTRSKYNLSDDFTTDILFKEIGLLNPSGKKKFMTCPHDDATVIYVNGQCPIEYVLYDTIAGKSQLKVKGNNITTKVKEEAFETISAILLECIGAKLLQKSNNHTYNLRGAFDNYDTFLHLEIADFDKTWLDWAGWQCPCLMVDNIENIIANMGKFYGFDYSLDVLRINGRMLKICFIQIDGLEVILELIAPGD